MLEFHCLKVCKAVCVCSCSHTEVPEESTADRMEEDKSDHDDDEEDRKLPQSHLTSSPWTSGTQTAAACSADGGRTWWVTDVPTDRPDQQPASGGSRWDFSSISFPDIGSREHLSSCLFPPDPSLLPDILLKSTYISHIFNLHYYFDNRFGVAMEVKQAIHFSDNSLPGSLSLPLIAEITSCRLKYHN